MIIIHDFSGFTFTGLVFCLILAAELVMPNFEHQEGIRLKSGAVPAAVNSTMFLQLTPLSRHRRDGKAAKMEQARRPASLSYNIQSFREKKLGVTKSLFLTGYFSSFAYCNILNPFKIIT